MSIESSTYQILLGIFQNKNQYSRIINKAYHVL